MSNEEKLVRFYGELAKVSQKDLFSSTIFFETAIVSMVFGREFGEDRLMQVRLYDYFLLENITYNNYAEKKSSSEISNCEGCLEPFAGIAEEYYTRVLADYFYDPLNRSLVSFIDRLAADLEMDRKILLYFF